MGANSERFDDPEEALRAALQGFQRGLWTAMPAIVQSFDPVKATVVVQPAIKATVADKTGATKKVTLPLLTDVPVVFPRGGNCTLTFPIIAGDECLVVFASRCIDVWWQQGGVQPAFENRYHDLSDGFALVGPFSQATKIAGISTSAVQLRSNDGQAYVQLNPSNHQVDTITTGKVTVQAGGDIVLQGGANLNVTIAGNATVAVTGNATLSAASWSASGPMAWSGNWSITGNFSVTGAMSNNGKSVGSTHTHNGVLTGGGNTGVPN